LTKIPYRDYKKGNRFFQKDIYITESGAGRALFLPVEWLGPFQAAEGKGCRFVSVRKPKRAINAENGFPVDRKNTEYR
jgi:hypothetical protein